MPDIDTDSETDRLAGVENVPREPSGNDSVWISIEERPVVGLLAYAEPGRVEGFRREGLGGRGGRASSASCAPFCSSFEVPVVLASTFELPIPPESSFCSAGVIGSVA